MSARPAPPRPRLSRRCSVLLRHRRFRGWLWAIAAGPAISAALQGPTPASEQPIRAATFRSGPPDSGAVALTFDDGPHPSLTPRLIQTLKGQGATATFFLLGEQVEKFPDVARSLAEAGFELGNHGYSHRDLTRLEGAALHEEIGRTQALIEAATGRRPHLFRPPYGQINDTVARAAAEEGLDIVTWSVDPRDWDRNRTPEQILDQIDREGAAGAIILLHDIHARTIDLTPGIIEGLRAKALRFAAAGELVEAEKAARRRREAERSAEGSGPASASPATPPIVPLRDSAPPRS